jgi:hypothetical protein
MVRRHLARRCRRLVIELQEVSGLDPIGLTTLLAVLTHAGPDNHVIRVAQVGCDDLPVPSRLVVEFDDGGNGNGNGHAGPGPRPLPASDLSARPTA